MSLSLNWLTAQAAYAKLQQAELTSVELLQACLNRINCRESQVHAWEYLAAEQAEIKAEAWDRRFQADMAKGIEQTTQVYPLSGIPVAVKDIFATLDMPTQWGADFYRGRFLDHEAAVVSRLKAAGAIILGKTVTTELATAASGPTANPHHLSHTPGGSSSGSAAAVADGMVPLAIGSQTMGSIIRPAAYCGVFGFKPSFGLISRYGMMPVCDDLDHVGVFARCLADIQQLLAVLVGPDNRDPACQSRDRFKQFGAPSWRQREESQTPQPHLALIKTPHWSQAEDVMLSRLSKAASVLEQAGMPVDIVTLPTESEHSWDHVQALCAHGLWVNHGSCLDVYGDLCSSSLKVWFQRGQAISTASYTEIRQYRSRYLSALAPILKSYDAVLTLATPGPAPLGLAHTGSPIFCGLWTLCGLPTINLPLGRTDDGLPLGCQLVGSLYADLQLLQIADQCWHLLKGVFGGIKPLLE